MAKSFQYREMFANLLVILLVSAVPVGALGYLATSI